MTEIDLECWDTKTVFYGRGVNKVCKMITYSHLNSSDFNDNFKDTLCRKKLSQYWSY